MSDHTAEPWEIGGSIDERSPNIFARHAEPIPLPIAFVHSISGQPAEANARRIVACVNACAGILTEVIESFDGVQDVFSSWKAMDKELRLLRQQVADLRAASDDLSDALMRDWNRSTKESAERVVATWKRLTEVIAATQQEVQS